MKRWFLLLLAVFVAPLVAEDNPFFDVKGLAPTVVNYTSEADALALAQTRRVVYFFAADWCELCAADMAELRTKTSEIPSDVTLIVVDFDNAGDLRIKYGIPLQDVFLQIDSQGKKKALWVGGGVAALKKKVKS